MIRLKLFSPLHTTQPAHAFLNKLLDLGFDLSLGQMEIVNGADAQDALARAAGADAVHERAARGAEVVGHGVARGDGPRLAKGLKVVAAAHVLEVRVGDGEVGCEHGGGDFAAVGAVADEAVDQTGALGWLVVVKR